VTPAGKAGKRRSIGSPFMEKGTLRAFLKERAGELLNLSRNKLRIITGLLTVHH